VETQLDVEQDLIVRAQRGEVAAYEALVTQYETLAFRAAYLITHDADEAADAAQDGFLRAYKALRSFKLGQPFRPWLLRIVTNLALNRIKSSQRRQGMTDRFTQQAVVESDHLTIEGIVAQRAQSQRLLQAVNKLDRDQQTLIALRYFLELSEDEVAQTLNVPIGTVKSRTHRTLARLRSIIQNEFPDLVEMTTDTASLRGVP
jgi:RNA polymerase sigma factor (sigma-70 family)